MNAGQQVKSSAQAPELSVFESVAEWHAREVGAVFPTLSSVAWFIKRHRPRLIEEGALIPGEGRRPSLLNREKFPRVVIEIMRVKGAAPQQTA